MDIEQPRIGTESRSGFGHAFGGRYIVLALVMALVIVAAALGMKPFPPGSKERIAFALVQGVATAVVIVVPWRGLRQLDEMQQRIQLEALSIAFVGTAVLCSTYGFLENAGLPHLEWGAFIWPIMVLLWAIGTVIACRRYR
jgi:hypothetical protein